MDAHWNNGGYSGSRFARHAGYFDGPYSKFARDGSLGRDRVVSDIVGFCQSPNIFETESQLMTISYYFKNRERILLKVNTKGEKG